MMSSMATTMQTAVVRRRNVKATKPARSRRGRVGKGGEVRASSRSAGAGAGAAGVNSDTRRGAILRGLVGLSGAVVAVGMDSAPPASALLEQDEDLELLEKIRAKKQVRLSVEAQQGECVQPRAETETDGPSATGPCVPFNSSSEMHNHRETGII